mmetsp:Transcript_12104/g.12993  ORF Transcript_12104/g.12993 Transcript_12104/m.12993 type:complete len:93 (-) Transcript_12104:104-382(-)
MSDTLCDQRIQEYLESYKSSINHNSTSSSTECKQIIIQFISESESPTTLTTTTINGDDKKPHENNLCVLIALNWFFFFACGEGNISFGSKMI